MTTSAALIEDGEWDCFDFERMGDGTPESPEILVVTVDNPGSALNAVNETLHREIARLFRGLRRETHARAIVLTGRGKAFCAGGDFDWFKDLRTTEALEDLGLDARQLIWDLLDIPRPLVCGVNGHAMGLGASIALLSDLVVMSSAARIGDPHVNVGLVAGDGGTVIWPAVLGPARAKEFLFLGTQIDATTALDLGLVNKVAEPDQVRSASVELATRVALQPPMAVKYTKLAVNQQLRATLLTSFDTATAFELSTFHSDDHAEAIAAIQEKRQPRFTGQ